MNCYSSFLCPRRELIARDDVNDNANAAVFGWVSHRPESIGSGGSRISQRGAPAHAGMHQPIIVQIFCRKLHENERNWTETGWSVLGAPLDPPLIEVFGITFESLLLLKNNTPPWFGGFNVSVVVAVFVVVIVVVVVHLCCCCCCCHCHCRGSGVSPSLLWVLLLSLMRHSTTGARKTSLSNHSGSLFFKIQSIQEKSCRKWISLFPAFFRLFFTDSINGYFLLSVVRWNGERPRPLKPDQPVPVRYLSGARHYQTLLRWVSLKLSVSDAVITNRGVKLFVQQKCVVSCTEVWFCFNIWKNCKSKKNYFIFRHGLHRTLHGFGNRWRQQCRIWRKSTSVN